MTAPSQIAGGAACARQAIAAGPGDEIDLQINQVILGSGEAPVRRVIVRPNSS